MKRFFKSFIFALVIAFVIFGIFMAFFAQSLFYYPQDGKSEYTPQHLGLLYEDVYFESLDATKLHGWFIPAKGRAKGTVVQVHGNAGKLENHLDFIAWLPAQNYNVFTFDYRSYGLSEGKKPTPKALMEDTKSAIAYVRSRADVDAQNILILAQSLGGNNAIAAVGSGQKRGVRGMVIDSTFFSYKMIADDKFIGGGLFVSDEYGADRFIGNISPIPVLFMHGTDDMVVPYEHSQKLYELSLPPKKFITIPHGGHLSALLNKVYQDEVLRFFDESLSGK